MSYTYAELHEKTVADLRKIAQGIEDEGLHGFSTMHKEHLLPALCKALKIELHEHHKVVGLNKREIKAKIRGLKAKRTGAIGAHDHKQLKAIRRRIHRMKRRIHAATR